MHEDVTTKLTQFTPTLPDRDALLYAAGRASARPAPVWKVLCGLLAVGQITTVVFWLARPTPIVQTISAPGNETAEETPSSFTLDPYSYLALSKASDLDPPRTSSGPIETDHSSPPLKAGWRGELPN